MFLILSQTTNFRLFQAEQICRVLNFMKMAESCPKRVENTMGKGEITPIERFLLFSQCFQKT